MWTPGNFLKEYSPTASCPRQGQREGEKLPPHAYSVWPWMLREEALFAPLWLPWETKISVWSNGSHFKSLLPAWIPPRQQGEKENAEVWGCYFPTCKIQQLAASHIVSIPFIYRGSLRATIWLFSFLCCPSLTVGCSIFLILFLKPSWNDYGGFFWVCFLISTANFLALIYSCSLLTFSIQCLRCINKLH